MWLWPSNAHALQCMLMHVQLTIHRFKVQIWTSNLFRSAPVLCKLRNKAGYNFNPIANNHTDTWMPTNQKSIQFTYHTFTSCLYGFVRGIYTILTV